METYNIDIKITKCRADELSALDSELVESAKKATKNSYAIYSHFNVGAAVRLTDNEIIQGCNQENVAFPSGICAERSAIFAAQARHPDKPIVALAIAAFTGNKFTDDPVTPCGSCRQVMLQIEKRYNKPIKIILYGQKFCYIVSKVSDLLPLSFNEL